MYSYKYSFIDRTGKVILDASKYESVSSFSDGLAHFYLEEKNSLLRGFIDKSGNEVIAPQFYNFRHFSEGLAAVKVEGKWGFIDKTGRIVIKPAYDVANRFSEGVAIVAIGEDLLLIDRNGRTIWSRSMNILSLNIYDGTGAGFSEGVVEAFDCEEEKNGFIDKSGRFVIEPAFNAAGPFSEGLARVTVIENEEEKLGFIDHRGRFVIPPRFNTDWDFRRNSTNFSEGLVSLTEGLSPSITEGENFIYIDKTGEIVLFTDFFYAGPFREGLAVVYDEENGKWGFIDKSGKVAIPVQYDLVQDFSEGLACVATKIA